MQARIASLTSENEELMRQLSAKETEMDSLRLSYDSQLMTLTSELESVMSQLQVLMDAKLSLELEIATYMKLLEGEESRGASMSSMMSSAMGTQSSGAASLSAALSGGGSSMSMSGGGSSMGSSSQSMGKMTVQRSSKGAVGFASVDHAGGSIVLECDAVHAQARGANLRGWKVQKSVSGRVTFSVVLTDFTLTAGATYTIWAKGAKEVASSQNEMVADAFSFGVGTCSWQLFDANGQEKATLNATVS